MNLRDINDVEQQEAFYKYLNKMPIYIKALEIYETCYVLSDKFHAKRHKEIFYELFKVDQFPVKAKEILHIIEMQEKIDKVMYSNAGSVVYKLYEIRAIAEDLLMNIRFISGCIEKEDMPYFLQLIKEMNEFRYLFIDWLKTFKDHSNKIDKWGFTNPLKRISEFKQYDDENNNELYYGNSLLK